MRSHFFAALCLALPLGLSAQPKPSDLIQQKVVGYIYKPEKVKPTADRIKTLSVPEGFVVQPWAQGLGKPRMLAVADDGTVYVSRRDSGDVLMLRPDRQQRAGAPQQVARIKDAHGLTIHNNKLYVAAIHDVYEAAIRKDGTLATPQKIISGLPDGGQHANRTLRFGPDGKLYISVGSTCNACNETSPESATLVVADPNNGWERRIFAKGLRNTIGFDWHPTGGLYGLDHGIDWLGDDAQREELNQLLEGKDYGWPYVYEDGRPNLADAPPAGQTWAEYAQKTTPPVLTYTAHSAPLSMLFYRGTQFPAAYRQSAFVAMHGSWNRSEPSGYKVVRVVFDAQGRPQGFEDFMTGFLTADNKQVFGRVCGMAEAPDGALYVSDDDQGVIYRVAYAPDAAKN